jgi:hypothetical protein
LAIGLVLLDVLSSETDGSGSPSEHVGTVKMSRFYGF